MNPPIKTLSKLHIGRVIHVEIELMKHWGYLEHLEAVVTTSHIRMMVDMMLGPLKFLSKVDDLIT